MKSKIINEKLILILGGLTLILFAMRPYLLDLIEPARSIGTLIGENAKDLIDSMKGETNAPTNSKRDIWSNIITILAFVFFTLTLILSFIKLQDGANKWIIAGAIALSIIGLGVYILHLAVGLVALIAIALIVAVFVFLD